MRSVEFRRELRLKATRRIFELSFSRSRVSQPCVQPVRPQYQKAEQKHEQYFYAEPHALPLRGVLIGGDGRCCASWPLFLSFYG